MIINDEVISGIKEKVDIREGMEYYGIEFNRRGFAKCPFHEDKTPSMIARKGNFHCFGCGEHGDIINFIQKYFSLGFHDAVEKINKDFCLGLGRSRKVDTEEFREQMIINETAKRLKEDETDLNHQIYDFYCDELRNLRKVVDVLSRRMEAIEKDMDNVYDLRLRFESEGHRINELKYGLKR